MIAIILFGILLVSLSISFWGQKEKSSFYMFYNYASLAFFGTLGILLMSLSFLGLDGILVFLPIDTTHSFAAVISFFFSSIFLGSVIMGLDSEFEFKKETEKVGRGRPFLFGLGVGSILLGGGLLFFSFYFSDVAKSIFSIVKSPLFFIFMMILLAVIFVLIVVGPLNFEMKYERRIDPYTTVVINRKKSCLLPIVFIVLIFILACVSIVYKGSIHEGQITDTGAQQSAGDAIGTIYWSIMGDLRFVGVVVLVLVGGLAKVVAAGRAAKLVSNVLILWLPAFSWVLVLVGVIEPLGTIKSLFNDVEFIAYLVYLMIYGTLMVGLSAAVSVFHSFQSLGE